MNLPQKKVILTNIKNDIEYIKFKFEEMNRIDQISSNTNNTNNIFVASKNNKSNSDHKEKKSFFGMVKRIFK
jgi:hypothetical protein